MPSSKHWFVLTGGPSSGKTTLLAELDKRGFATVPEAARAVIDDAIVQGITPAELRRDERAFQNAVAERKIVLEAVLSQHQTTFFDRGMHDSLAYLQHYSFSIEDWIIKACQEARYAAVFLLEPLANYQNDYARTEDDTFYQKIHGLLKNVYQEARLPVIQVPALPLPERAEFILQHINTGVTV